MMTHSINSQIKFPLYYNIVDLNNIITSKYWMKDILLTIMYHCSYHLLLVHWSSGRCDHSLELYIYKLISDSEIVPQVVNDD